jgi:protein-L-isoaspartate O-methyltransferase
MPDGSTLTMPPPSVVATALEALDLSPGRAFLDVGCGSGYVTAVAAVMVGPSGTVHGIECVSSRLEAARSNLRRLRERLPGSSCLVGAASPAAVAASSAPDALAAAALTLSNVLVPECTEGLLYDALYCDTSVGEEDLPSFLALLRHGGRAVVVLEEELLLLTRTGADAHDFSRAALAKVSGDFGELEDPTPWEVQEAIARIKAREHKKGLEQAKVGGGEGRFPAALGDAGLAGVARSLTGPQRRAPPCSRRWSACVCASAAVLSGLDTAWRATVLWPCSCSHPSHSTNPQNLNRVRWATCAALSSRTCSNAWWARWRALRSLRRRCSAAAARAWRPARRLCPTTRGR